MSDYIKLPRSTLGDDLWRDGNIARVYLYLLSKVDELISFREAAKSTELSLQQVRTAIEKLKSSGRITQIATQKTTQVATQVKLCGINDKGKSATQIATQIATQVATQKTTQAKPSLEPYIDPLFADVWRKWLDYRKEVKKTYKSKASARTAYEKMVRMADNDPEQAMDMVDRAILGQWQGLHETKQYGTAKSNTAKESRDRMRSLATEIVSRSENLLNLYNGQGSDPDHRPN